MSITRRKVLAGSAAGAASLASGLAAPAIAQNEPIKIGYLPALTGPSSSTGIGINRGTLLAVDEINAAGGINGRKIELIVRDTQSDPTKAVNAVAELTQRQKVAIIWGPLNSGEALAATPLIARDKVPMLHPCWVDELIDVKKYPMSFRIAPTNTQVGAGANYYVVDVLKLKKVAVISDTTGYGTASVNTYVPMLKAKGAEVVYTEPCRRGEPRPQARAAAHAERRRAGDHAVERERRLPVAHSQYPRRHGLGRAGGRPDDPGLRPDQGAAREARELEQGLLEQLPPGLLRRRQAAGARPGIRRPPEEGQDRDGRHAVVVDRARLGRRQDDGRDAQGHRAEGRRHRRPHGTRPRAGRASTAPSPGRRSSTTASPTPRS